MLTIVAAPAPDEQRLTETNTKYAAQTGSVSAADPGAAAALSQFRCFYAWLENRGFVRRIRLHTQADAAP